MNVSIKIVDHKDQKYETVGNWGFAENGDIWIEVSRLSDWRKEMLIAVHELCEVLMCKQDGVDQGQVDQFDLEFEARRLPGNKDEPGDDQNAPYIRQHCAATGIERILAYALGVDWKPYEEELDALTQKSNMNNEPKPEEPQDAKVRAEEVAHFKAQLGEQQAPACQPPSDMFRAPTENLGDVKER